jgi:hypothetical protein
MSSNLPNILETIILQPLFVNKAGVMFSATT